MKRNFLLLQFVALMVSLFLLSCAESEHSDNIPEDTSSYITWSVASTVMQGSRSMIENDEMLQSACTGGARAIGIWSAYELNGAVKKNVLGNDNGDVALIYQKDTEWDNYRWWSYGETAAKWLMGAKYTFNAYYPMHVISEISTSDISTFVVEFNTETYQEDLMMAYSFVDTNEPTFKLGVPVTLNMLHTLSAIRFRFSFMDSDGETYEDSDALTAFWLENTQLGKGLATTGMLAFGTYNEDGSMDGEHIHWYYEDRPLPSTATKPRPIYQWEDAAGVEFSSTSTQRVMATAYTTGGQKFAQNNGFVLVIPQEIDGTVQMCFRLRSTGELVHRVTLPVGVYEPAKRYTYDIRFGRTNVTVKLTIADWNELKSSQDIPL